MSDTTPTDHAYPGEPVDALHVIREAPDVLSLRYHAPDDDGLDLRGPTVHALARRVPGAVVVPESFFAPRRALFSIEVYATDRDGVHLPDGDDPDGGARYLLADLPDEDDGRTARPPREGVRLAVRDCLQRVRAAHDLRRTRIRHESDDVREALQAFDAAAHALRLAWEDASDPIGDALASGYPDGVPSFDEFAESVHAWREQVAADLDGLA